ncbi:hypothetical protein HDA32_003939 [Spinactinospora alkalitolerans]|uniref:Uncharacterized protein n=1 Tax=Spinactinospora alkalitolerans TaxID=687207 RepID=A0A852TXU5_9ACTN|nr:hypothetical protein [Spinactinospora alkalitolerans]NYE48819.1 hypothetical protein [Spinactinospora alkalitolerans]
MSEHIGSDGAGGGARGGTGPDREHPFAYRRAEQHAPPPAERATDVAITRFEHAFEVDPRLMERWVLQQEFPNWDTLRIMNGRHDHLEWMHRHFARTVVSGAEILAEVEDASEARGPGDPGAPS